MREPHRADAYCRRCGGRCADPDTLAKQIGKPLSLGPAFTGPGEPTFRPTRKPGRFE